MKSLENRSKSNISNISRNEDGRNRKDAEKNGKDTEINRKAVLRNKTSKVIILTLSKPYVN